MQRKSKWTYKTSGTVAFAVGPAGAAKGVFVLRSPIGYDFEFHYISISAGVSLGIPVSATYSDADTFSAGDVWLLDGFQGELEPSDFEGFCRVEELTVGVGMGGSGTAMFFDVPAYPGGWLQKALEESGATKAAKKRSSGSAALMMRGFNGGFQAGVGISTGAGYIWTGDSQPEWLDYLDDMPVGPENLAVPYRLDQSRDGFWSFPTTALFDFDKAIVKPGALIFLFRLAHAIQQLKPRVVYIDGHTDSTGKMAYNQRLSERRAAAVKSVIQPFLMNVNIVASGYGESRPFVSNVAKIGRGLNRRVEIHLHHD